MKRGPSRPRAATFIEIVLLASMLVSVVFIVVFALVTSAPTTHLTSTGASTPHSTGSSIFLILVPGALVVLGLAATWLTWHFRHHAKKTPALAPTSPFATPQV